MDGEGDFAPEKEAVKGEEVPAGVRALGRASQGADRGDALAVLGKLRELDAQRQNVRVALEIEKRLLGVATGQEKTPRKPSLLRIIDKHKAEGNPQMREAKRVLRASPELAGQMIDYHKRRREIDRLTERAAKAAMASSPEGAVTLVRGGTEKKPVMTPVKVEGSDLVRWTNLMVENPYARAQFYEKATGIAAAALLESYPWQTIQEEARKKHGKFNYKHRLMMENGVAPSVFRNETPNARHDTRAAMIEAKRRHDAGELGQLPLATLMGEEAFADVDDLNGLAELAGGAAEAQRIYKIHVTHEESTERRGGKDVVTRVEALDSKKAKIGPNGRLVRRDWKGDEVELPKARQEKYWQLRGIQALANQLAATMSAKEAVRNWQKYGAATEVS